MSDDALLLTTLGGLLLLGLLAEGLGRRTRLPSVTLLLLVGVAAGPLGFDLLPDVRESWFPLIAKVALVMVGVLLGAELDLGSLRERGRRAVVTSACVAIATFIIVTVGLAAFGLDPATSALVGAVAVATDPAATLVVVREAKAKGRLTRNLLDVVAVDDAWGIIIFGVVSGAVAGVVGEGEPLALLGRAGWELLGGAALGVGLGFSMALVTGRIRPGEPTRVEAMAFVLLCGGLAAWLDVSYLLAAVVMGATLASAAAHHDRPLHEIENVEVPFLVTFFVLAGASLDLDTLRSVGWLVVGYVVLRVIGRVAGAAAAGTWLKAPRVKRWMGVAMLPQAGVALGMALVASERFPELAEPVLAVAIVATVFFELVGPFATRLALDRAGESGAAEG